MLRSIGVRWQATRRRSFASCGSNGCAFVRKGTGDHQIWYSPITERNFPVDGNIKSRHWANIVLKQAGIEKTF
jgi:hypothetical protein